MGEWEASKQFDKILISIGRSRKYLLDIFNAYNKRGTVIDYELAKGIMS
jgi:hypothetical protein